MLSQELLLCLLHQGLGILQGGFGATQGDTVVGITKSTVVLDRVIDKNGLLTREPEGFSIDPEQSKASLLLLKRRSLKCAPGCVQLFRSKSSRRLIKRAGLYLYPYRTRSPEMAVQLAQSVFDETLAVMQNVAVTPSAQQRLFIEEQLKENNKALAKAENDLSAFLKDTGMSSPSGTPSDIGSLGALQARMVAKEIEIKAARRFATDANPKLKQLQAEYNAIKKQFEDNKGITAAASPTGDDQKHHRILASVRSPLP
jgi:tyrosine-protein kinase Etk/Wzc